jgi:glycosyltransferase involved in cell wall biosynthesis
MFMSAVWGASLTVVVPAYNEATNLPIVVPQMVAFVRKACRSAEIVIVDDGSRDGTGDVSVDLARQFPEVRVIQHPENRGITAALRTGFFGALNDFVTVLPSDGQIDPGELSKLFAVFQDHDLVLTTYRHRPDGLVRMVMSRSVRVMLRLAIGLRDRLEGTYLFRRSLLLELDLVAQTSAGAIGLEIAAKARDAGKRIATCEIECLPRLSGRSKVANARNIAEYLREIWRIRASMQREKPPSQR